VETEMPASALSQMPSEVAGALRFEVVRAPEAQREPSETRIAKAG